MNYYSIEFFKHFLKQALDLNKKKSTQELKQLLQKLLAYVEEREESNKFAYSKKHMRKLEFTNV